MSLKLQTARTLKWNAIDRLSTQVLYAVTGVVLANILSKEEFGLVGALAIFQAFATIFVDSGFGAALLRDKNPTQRDYSTVFWFNTAMSVGIYSLLFVAAPLIARIFDNQQVLVPMSKLMFLTFVVNALSIVQVNIRMKRMDVRMIAIANSVSLIGGAAVGIIMALKGCGAWAIVWQNLVMATVKTAVLWATGKWTPSLKFSAASLRKIRKVGVSVFSSSLLNTVSLNIYNFVIGAFYGMVPLGVYTQADKWSKMGYTSISQTLTSSFVPLMATVQDNVGEFQRYARRTGRFTAIAVLPAMCFTAAMATTVFHLLFGTKWDDAVPLFQILAIRGIFVVFTGLYSNYLLALGESKKLFLSEAIKDALILVSILVTVFSKNITLLVAGQLVASVLTWVLLVPLSAKSMQMRMRSLLGHIVPFIIPTLAGVTAILAIPYILPGIESGLRQQSVLVLTVQILAGIGVYAIVLSLVKNPELPEFSAYIFGRFRKKKRG